MERDATGFNNPNPNPKVPNPRNPDLQPTLTPPQTRFILDHHRLNPLSACCQRRTQVLVKNVDHFSAFRDGYGAFLAMQTHTGILTVSPAQIQELERSNREKRRSDRVMEKPGAKI